MMGDFSKYYDIFVGADYDQISAFLDSRIKKNKSGSKLVCELGCGTASVTSRMEKLGYDMIGIDSDEGMLMHAMEKVGERTLLLNQDITEFELYGTVDVIYSTLDTMNYLLEDGELDSVFSLVRNYLNYDGLFIFDVNSEYKFKSVLGCNSFVYDDDGVFCTWQTEYDEADGICDHYLTYFEKKADGSYLRTDDLQCQRFYPREQIEALAREYGFEILEIADDYSDDAVDLCSERLTYVLKINK